jgi:phosphatidylethanolamine/phosphatidyl-N-methylethanolamine N-methyltransferase
MQNGEAPLNAVGELCRQSKRPRVDNRDLEAAWARWAPFYDLIYSAWLAPGRRAGAVAASRLQGPFLDVGVGTGLELPMFAPGARVFGVDLSEPMLRRAVDRVQRCGLCHVEGLACMDATRLAFPDSSFGGALLMYVLTVVPDPAAVMDEVARVVSPGGEIMIVSRISPETSALVGLERWFGRQFGPRLGWRPYFPWSVLGDWLGGRTDMRLVERRRCGSLGLFTLVRIQRKR